jgi:hypothetical protein
MKSSKSSFTFKSFQDLKALLENKPFSFPERHHADLIDHREEQCPELEEKLFKKAMEGVRPIARPKAASHGRPASRSGRWPAWPAAFDIMQS